MKDKITYKPLPIQFGEGLVATYKGVKATIYIYDMEKTCLIYTIQSNCEGIGECREFIKLLREKYPVIKSSVALTQRWANFCKLNNIEIIED